jgi:multidrug efflux pump subunit AcrA (membrane-fusion protein)
MLTLAAVGLQQFGPRSRGHREHRSPLAVTPVVRGDLVTAITKVGHVQSADSVEIRCLVPGPLTILKLVDDGAVVNEGDLLAQLDSSAIKDAVIAQRIRVADAKVARLTAERNLSAARFALEEYRNGILPQEQYQLQSALNAAGQGLWNAMKQLDFARKMHSKGYQTDRKLKLWQDAVERATLTVNVAETRKEVLTKFHSKKMLLELECKRDVADAQYASKVAACELEAGMLRRRKHNLENCKIHAPRDGLVVHANDDNSRGAQQGPPIALGATVNQFQLLMRLPDLRQMQVKILVHESQVGRLRIGMRSQIRIGEDRLQGTVTAIANQPQPTGRWRQHIKEFATIVKIDGECRNLRPGMTAEVTIVVDERDDVLMVPVECVVERDKKFFAGVGTDDGAEMTELVLGATNGKMIEVANGLEAGQCVLSNPRDEISKLGDDDQALEAGASDSNP